MIATLAPVLRGRQRRALAREAGPDDQDVVFWHGSLGSLWASREGGTAAADSITGAQRWPAARGSPAAGRSAWRTCASVTTPCSTPSSSTATIAPSRPQAFGAEQRFQRRRPRRCAPAGPPRARRRPAARGARPRSRCRRAAGARRRGSGGRGRRRRTTASGSAGRTAPGRPAGVTSAGIVTGSRSMMSATVMLLDAPPERALRTAAPAAW